MHIPQRWAPKVNKLNKEYLNPYINFHRPCYFPEIKIDAKGKEKKTYPYKTMMTPYDKLKSLPNAQQYLKPGGSFEMLDKEALLLTDLEAAKAMCEARKRSYAEIFSD